MIAIAKIATGISAKVFANKTYDTEAISNELSNTLKTWIIENEAQYYRDITVVVTPTDIEIKNNKMEGIFSVVLSQILKAENPEELPMIRGMKKFIDSNEESMSTNKAKAVNNELDSWLAEVKGYIGKTQTLNSDFKIVADLSSDGSILPETVNFFASDGQGSFYKVDSLVDTADQMESAGFNHVKEIADKTNDAVPLAIDTYRRCDLAHPPLPNKNDPAETRYYEEYNDYLNHAANYADSFSYNREAYNDAYYACLNDCANFVSQAMYAGGIPIDYTHDVTHWWCVPPNPPLDYSPWCFTTPVPQNCNTGLKNYMINNGYWVTSNFDTANAGCVMMWKDTSGSAGHVAMIVQNDTVNHAYSAHNKDHRHFQYYSEFQNDCDFYAVHNYGS